MGISYNLGIPAATHNPSIDQPNMQVNTNSIAQIIAVDHVGFSTTGSGQHNQVTFNANNVPAVPTAPPVLFTNTVGSLPQLFFYSGPATSSSNQYVNNGTAGSTFLLGGMIQKWGMGAATGGGPENVTFAGAFPNACYVVVVTGTSSLYTGGFVITAKSQTGFNISRTSGSGSTGYYYIAIGF
jgi:hypothetical protein